MEQLRDYERWKTRHGYGKRARVESAISSFKRTFGEHITSVKWSSVVNELLVKASVYNLFVGEEPVARTQGSGNLRGEKWRIVKLFDTPPYACSLMKGTADASFWRPQTTVIDLFQCHLEQQDND